MAITDQTASWYIGNRHVLRFTLVDEDDGNDPHGPLVITGKTLKFALAKKVNGVPKLTPEIEKSTASGIVITDGANGECEVTIDDSDTLDFKPAIYYFELELFEPGPSDPIVVATGDAELLLNVNNS